jgi:hypothetical protein
MSRASRDGRVCPRADNIGQLELPQCSSLVSACYPSGGRIPFAPASWAMSGTRALMLRLNCRLGPVRGSRRFNALQIGSQGRAPHIRILRAFDVDQRRVRWIFNSP